QPGKAAEVIESLLPLTVAPSEGHSTSPREVHLHGEGAPPYANLINGFHRVFLARLFGADSFRCRLLDQGVNPLPMATPAIVGLQTPSNTESIAAPSIGASSFEDISPRVGSDSLPQLAQDERSTGLSGRFWDNYIEKT